MAAGIMIMGVRDPVEIIKLICLWVFFVVVVVLVVGGSPPHPFFIKGTVHKNKTLV